MMPHPSQVDAETRKALYKLRTTWLPYFPAHILSAIDRHCHGIDPNWPVQQVVIVTPTPPSPTIFVNRDFLTVSEGAHPRRAHAVSHTQTVLC